MKRCFYFVLPLIVALAAQAVSAAEPIGVVVGLQGCVQAASPDGTTRTLKLRESVFMGDTLRTGEGAKLQVVFSDDSLFSLGEKTEAVLDEYVYAPARAKENTMIIRMLRGFSRIVTGRITDLNPDRFTVKTGRATIGIRGCELGFWCGDESDRVYVVRVPRGRLVRITSSKGAHWDLRGPGWMEVWDDGRAKRGMLTDEDIQTLSDGTTPSGEPESEEASGEQGEPQKGPRESEEEQDEPSPPTTETTTGNPAEALRDEVINDPANPESQLVEPQNQPAAPVQPAAPSAMLKGGGVGGSYVDMTQYAALNNVVVYDRVTGTLGDGFTSVDIEGRRVDANGIAYVPFIVSFRDIPLAQFGGREWYEGWVSRDVSPGVRIANDNLQEFVVRTDRNKEDQRLLYWGYPASAFAGSTLPADRAMKYEVTLSLFPPRTPVPHDPASELRQGLLVLNTRTGGFYVENPGGRPFFGPISDLQFFGRQSQGVGATLLNSATIMNDPGYVALALAGFRRAGSEIPVESGGWSRFGYAASIGVPIDFAAPIREMHSAAYGSDDPLLVERQVVMHLNRLAAQYNLDLDLRVFENPAAPTINDLRLLAPSFSTFVDGFRYGASIRNPQVRADLYGGGVGENWTWGEWDGEQTVDHGGGSLMHEETHGHYVVGDTLSAAAFQLLVDGAAGYNLHTPSDRPGHVMATISSGNYLSRIFGTAMLNVTIPGGGASPTWSGAFHAGDMTAGDFMDVVYGTRLISANGHLSGTGPDSYALRANGTVYGMGTLTASDITGSLVGPGTGARPVTGAIGSGRFAHGDGTVINFTYGTDLVP